MKCPRCNGEGSVPYHIADDMFDETLCPLCGGTGEYVKSNLSPMQETNIEYLQLVSPTLLARFILQTLERKNDVANVVMNALENGIDEEEAIVEWLKQPHREE